MAGDPETPLCITLPSIHDTLMIPQVVLPVKYLVVKEPTYIGSPSIQPQSGQRTFPSSFGGGLFGCLQYL